MFYKFCCILCRIFCYMAFNLKIEGRENIPDKGAAIIAPNHRSNFDPVLTGIGCPRQIRFMAKAELFDIKIFGALISKLGAFPVHRGKGDVGAVKAAFAILKSENLLLMFPQGKRIKDGSRGKPKTGVTVIAHKMQSPVIPVYISGNYKFRSKVRVIYGKPISFEEYYGKKLDDETTNKLTEKIYDGIFDLANV